MFELTAQQKALQGRARELAQGVFAPTAAATDETEAYPWANVERLRAEGFMGMTIPRRSAGRAAASRHRHRDRGDGQGLRHHGAHHGRGQPGAIGAIMRYGTDAQRRLAAEAVLGGDKPAICISEPNAGSAASEMTTRADRLGDHYILNGEKYWITGGGVSRLHLIFARVFDDGIEQGIGAFLCMRDGDTRRAWWWAGGCMRWGCGAFRKPISSSTTSSSTNPCWWCRRAGCSSGFAALMNAYNAQRVGAGTVAGIAQGL